MYCPGQRRIEDPGRERGEQEGGQAEGTRQAAPEHSQNHQVSFVRCCMLLLHASSEEASCYCIFSFKLMMYRISGINQITDRMLCLIFDEHPANILFWDPVQHLQSFI